MYRLAVFILHDVPSDNADTFWHDIVKIKPQRLKLRKRSDNSLLRKGCEYFYFQCLQDDASLVETVWDKHRPLHSDRRVAQWRQECHWTKGEIDSAELLHARISRAGVGATPWSKCRTVDFGNPRVGVPFPWAWQTGPLRLAPSNLPRSVQAIDQACGTIIVNQHVVDRVEALRHQDIWLDPILHPTASQPTGWYQLGSWYKLPPFVPGTTGVQIEDHYGPGGEPSYFHSYDGFHLQINRHGVSVNDGKVPDISFTAECFGYWRVHDQDPAFASPLLVVSQRCMQQLKAAGVTRIVYEPVELLD